MSMPMRMPATSLTSPPALSGAVPTRPLCLGVQNTGFRLVSWRHGAARGLEDRLRPCDRPRHGAAAGPQGPHDPVERLALLLLPRRGPAAVGRRPDRPRAVRAGM